MKVFISYSSKDKIFVQRLSSDLDKYSDIDVFVDQLEINPGDMIPKRIEEGISEAEVFILVLSPDSVNSTWVDYERQAWLMMQIEEEKLAKEESRSPKRRLIPVLYRDCQKPAFLQPVHHISITDKNYEDGFEQLVSVIRIEPMIPSLKEETKRHILPEPGGPRRKYVLTLLKSLLRSQFKEVIFNYGMPSEYLPTNVSQVEMAIALIQYATQQEGDNMLSLLDTITPHLRGGH